MLIRFTNTNISNKHELLFLSNLPPLFNPTSLFWREIDNLSFTKLQKKRLIITHVTKKVIIN